MIGEQEEFLQDCCTSPWSYSGDWNKGKKMVALLEGYSIIKSQEQKRTFSMASKKTPKCLYSDNGPVTACCTCILRMTSINKFLPWNTTRPPKQNKVLHWLDGQHLLTSRQLQHRATGNRKPHLPPHSAGSTAGSLHQVKSLCSGFHFLYFCGCLKISSGKNKVENSINSLKTHIHTSVFANW